MAIKKLLKIGVDLIAQAWGDVSAATIINCWTKIDLMRTSNQHESRDLLDRKEANQERIEFYEFVSNLGEDSMSASEYIEL